MDFPGRLLASIVAVILVFLFPLQYIAELYNENIDIQVDEVTHRFTDTIRNNGYIDKETYEAYLGYLDTTGEMYELDLQDIHPVTGTEINGMAVHNSQGSFMKLSHGEIESFYPHVHTDEFYEGNRDNEDDYVITSISATPPSQTIERYSHPNFTVMVHYKNGTCEILDSEQYIIAGFDPTAIGLQDVTIIYNDEEIIKSCVVNVEVKALDKECHRCHQVYELSNDDSDPGCPYCKKQTIGIEVSPDNVEITQGEGLPITVIGIYSDGSKEEVSGWTSNYNAERLGVQIVTIEYGGYATDIMVWVNEEHMVCPICGNEYLSGSQCPICDENVVNISVSPKEVTVGQYEYIPIIVTAYYANGNIRVVDDWSIDQTTLTPGTYQANVSYKEAVDTITLTVLSLNNIECPICGTNYDSSENLRGCPICSEELVGIEAYFTSGTNLVQLGSTPKLSVILIFRDGHRELVTDGYTLEDFYPDELGVQTARVIYKEFSATVVIEVINILDSQTCPNGHVFYRNGDGIEDEKCPFCHVEDDIGKVLYFNITYTSEIIDRIYCEGVYNINRGNYLSVILYKKDRSLLYILQNTFWSTSRIGRKRKFTYGGEVNKN